MTCPGPNARLAGGQIVSRVLKENGINTVFSLAGTTHTDVLDPLGQDGFTIVPGRSENGTVGAADGYARVTGKCGVALIIANQGVPNAMAAAEADVMIVLGAPRLSTLAEGRRFGIELKVQY
jgi:acetolactate synthase-1/2/3 large subunit